MRHPGHPHVLWLVPVVLAACGGGGTSGPTPLVVRHNFPLVPQTAGLQLAVAYPQLTFAAPVQVVAAPGDSTRLFVVEQGGTIRVFHDDPVTATRRAFLDLSSLVTAGGELGLLGLAFAPGYAQDRTFYVCYTAAPPLRVVLARYTTDATDPERADPLSRQELLAVEKPYGNHNGGQVAFGPDGMLYLSLGDGGGGGDPLLSSQNLGNLLGKILRLDVQHTDPGLPYAVPANNPFRAIAGARGEVYAYGLRNPWRFSFDRDTGELWVGDVGQGAREEIDLVTAGANLGWSQWEGELPFRAGAQRGGYAFPVYDYGRDAGFCVIGGVVYRGAALPDLRGAYLFADYGAGAVRALLRNTDGTVTAAPIGNLPTPAAIGETAAGEPIVVSQAGQLWQLVHGTGTGVLQFPQLLSATGLFADTAALLPEPWLFDYEVNAASWKDGAVTRRWVYTPGVGSFRGEDSVSLPVGAVLVKHFEFDDASMAAPRRLETRVLVHEMAGWSGYVYAWNSTQTDAELLAAGRTLQLQPRDGTPARSYDIPARAACNGCHTAAAGVLLGLSPPQLRRLLHRPGGDTQQLDWLQRMGVLPAPPPGLPDTILPDPYGTSDPAALARAWLHSNCAHCHRPQGTALDFDLRYSTAQAALNLVGVRPTAGDLGLLDPFRIAAGNKQGSVLWLRLRTPGPVQMPPLCTDLLDPAGALLVGAWIDALR